MKQRITYLLPQDSGLQQKDIAVEHDQLVFSKTRRAALEKRVTVGLSELPDEVLACLDALLNDQLLINWSAQICIKRLS